MRGRWSLVSVGERGRGRPRRATAHAIARGGPCLGCVAFGAASEPGGPAATSACGRLVRDVVSGKRFPSAWVVEPFGLTRGCCRSSQLPHSHHVTLPSGLFGCTDHYTLLTARRLYSAYVAR